MADIELACHTGAWGDDGFIAALADVERAGFKGIETTTGVVEQYEDRVEVFNEILANHHIKLMGITSGGATWPGMSLEEEVERSLNIVRFLRSAGAKVLTLIPPKPAPDSPIEEDTDIIPVATAYGEIARRTQEMGILPCLHPEIGTVVPDLKALKVFLEYSDPAAMLLCLDTGFLQQAGVPAIKFIRENKGKIGSVHLRDVKPLPGKKKKDAVPQYHTVELGKGQVELEEVVDTLLEIEFTGWATVELEKGSKTLMTQSKHSYEYAAHELDLVL